MQLRLQQMQNLPTKQNVPGYNSITLIYIAEDKTNVFRINIIVYI